MILYDNVKRTSRLIDVACSGVSFGMEKWQDGRVLES